MRRQSTAPFPPNKQPRVWFITAATSPIGLAVTRQLIEYGDTVVAGIQPDGMEVDDGRDDDFQNAVEEMRRRNEAQNYLMPIPFNSKSVSECQVAIAKALELYKRIDILLCCSSEALLGTIEELGQTKRSRSAVIDQFEANYFGPVNIIKAVLPQFRTQRSGHIMLFTAITGMVGTPGIGAYCASQWAIEGYCDSIAYEIAPFNIKTSIVQANIEVALLTNKITSVPSMDEYRPQDNPAPFGKASLAALIDKVDDSIGGRDPNTPRVSVQMNEQKVVSLYPPLRGHFTDNLIAETVHAILAIGGHANPPARHIVGFEGILSVKDKLKTVSEELEDFVEISLRVDYPSAS